MLSWVIEGGFWEVEADSARERVFGDGMGWL